jgi:tetratricopeptide (TPR) repeat protein
MSRLLNALVPGIPAAGATTIAAQAQGIPLFAVETIRTLIDRDIVVPQDGVYRLVADIGTLTVPDTLHGLLAARLDALNPTVRGLVADAAVVGTTFTPDGLGAVSGRTGGDLDIALAELVRRQVVEVSADPFSPEQGVYRFTHEMLRHVAYETLSRRDRKTRHLAAAKHLRTAFAGDGEEVIDIVCAHYLDALNAAPDASDAEQITQLAIDALTRAGERASRTGAPAGAAANYDRAAQLCDATSPLAAAQLWERAAAAANKCSQWTESINFADLARDRYQHLRLPRAVARADTAVGRALRYSGRHAEARARLGPALEALAVSPDIDTVRALQTLGEVETFAGGADGDRLTAQALSLGQALAVPPDILSDLFRTRGIWLYYSSRLAESASYFREAARIAEAVGDRYQQAAALLNLSGAVSADDPQAAASAAGQAIALVRQSGDPSRLAYAVTNYATALVATGDWDGAAATIAETIEVDGMGDDAVLCSRAMLCALRGDAESADLALCGLSTYLTSEDPQDRAWIAAIEAFVAVARSQPGLALQHARVVLGYADHLTISADDPRWAWPLAARSAHELRDQTTERELLEMLDEYLPGQLAPMLHAERHLVRARLAAAEGNTEADAQFGDAIAALRLRSTPYHLAHGLLDFAEYLHATDRAPQAQPLVAEATEIAQRLGARPVLDRAGKLITPDLVETGTGQ